MTHNRWQSKKLFDLFYVAFAIGIPIDLFDHKIQTTQAQLISDSTPLITPYINLPSYLTSNFLSWHSSDLPWIQKFSLVLPSLLNILPIDLPTTDYLYDPESNPSPIIKAELQQLRFLSYQTILQSQTPETQMIEPSLRSPFTSLALTSIPLASTAYCLPSSLFTIALQRKLRLHIHDIPKHCLCKTLLDPYGDNLFTCKQIPKT
jgi:hypothetical protein